MAEQESQGKSKRSSGSGGAGQKKSRLGAYLPILLAVVLAPVAAWLSFRFMSKGDTKKAAAPSASASTSHPSDETESKPQAENPTVRTGQRLTVPLTRTSVGFHPKKYVGKLAIMDVNGDATGEAQPETIRVNVANTRGARLVIARLAVQGDHPELLTRVNQSRHRLLDIASSTLGSKSFETVEKAGFTDVVRAELLNSFNEVLGSGTLQDVIFLQFDVK